MIDWLTFKVPFVHVPIDSGFMLEVAPGGEEIWRVPKRTNVRGSHESNMTIRSMGGDGKGNATYLSISGNPVKFLQGHNLFGTDDAIGLALATVHALDKHCSLGIPARVFRQVRQGNVEVVTVDINFSFQLGCQADVMSWIRAAEIHMRSRNGRPTSKPGTLYLQQHSKRWSLKFYSKFNEVVNGGKKHALAYTLGMDNINRLHEWAENVLRVELRLKATELTTLKMKTLKDLQGKTTDLFNHYLHKLTLADNMYIADKKMLDVPRNLLGTYELWKAGHDLRQVMTKTSFYRHRTLLLNSGVDITIRPDPYMNNVVPLVRILEAKPISVPTWAHENGLFFSPANRKEVTQYVRSAAN